MAPAFGARGVLQDGPSYSRTQEFGREALSGALQWPPGRAGGGAHDTNFQIGVWIDDPAVQRAVSPVRAGPTEQISPCRSGAISKDPGTAVSSLVNTSGRQPSRVPTHGLFLHKGCDLRARISLASDVQLGGDAARDSADVLPRVGLHVTEHGGSRDREGVKVCREFGNVCRVNGN